MKCSFIDQCSSVDFSNINDSCYKACEKCPYYAKINFLEKILE